MTLSENGKRFIQSFEGCKLTAYADPGTGGAPYTCGWGSTAGVKPGDTWTPDYAQLRFDTETAAFAERVKDLVRVKLTQNQFDALVSFSYNVGIRNFAGSTLLQDLNACHYSGAADQMLRWNRAAGKVMAGLTRRREAERDLFLKAD